MHFLPLLCRGLVFMLIHIFAHVLFHREVSTEFTALYLFNTLFQNVIFTTLLLLSGQRFPYTHICICKKSWSSATNKTLQGTGEQQKMHSQSGSSILVDTPHPFPSPPLSAWEEGWNVTPYKNIKNVWKYNEIQFRKRIYKTSRIGSGS